MGIVQLILGRQFGGVRVKAVPHQHKGDCLRLADLAIGERACIVTIDGERSFRRRLLELGFVTGTTVEMMAIAPLGGPMELKLRRCRISIRRAEAAKIEVNPA